MLEGTDSALSVTHPRLTRENKTIEAMIRMHCRSQDHAGKDLCRDCYELLDYARERLSRCPYQEAKTQCARCSIHCYKPAMRDKIRTVMMHAGPRMIYRHPILAFYHLIDGMRKEPGKPTRGAGKKSEAKQKIDSIPESAEGIADAMP